MHALREVCELHLWHVEHDFIFNCHPWGMLGWATSQPQLAVGTAGLPSLQQHKQQYPWQIQEQEHAALYHFALPLLRSAHVFLCG